MNLYEKHRPRTLDELVENDTMKKDLQVFLNGEQPLPHAILFTGSSGAGKTTTARILANSVADAQDIEEYNVADDTGVDFVRSLGKKMSYVPIGGKKRVFILDECHLQTSNSQSAMLKMLENPPEHVYWMLCTTDPQKLLKTILTRCVQFQVAPVSVKGLHSIVQNVAKAEGITLSNQAIRQIAINADGSPRAALTLLARVMGRSPEEQADEIASFVEENAQLNEICRALLKRMPWEQLRHLVRNVKGEPESMRYAVLAYMDKVLLNGDTPQAALVIECFSQPFFYLKGCGFTVACYKSVCS